MGGVLVVGGVTTQNPADGRYSNILEQALEHDGFPTSVTNMAQGSTTSVWNGMMLDQLLLDPSQQEDIDLIVWEHSINDFAAADGGPRPEQMLLFWLTRLRVLFANAGKPVPPILLVYLWKQDIGLRSDPHILEQGHAHDSHPSYAASLQMVKDQRQRYGLEIQVVDIAKLIPPSVFVEQRRTLLDDRHHPACAASRLIATTIQYALYSNLLGNGEEEHGRGRVRDVLSSVKDDNEPSTLPLPTPSTPLAELLFQDTTRIRSYTEWQPQRRPKTAQNTQALRISPASLQHAKDRGFLANIFPAADMPGRDDRKYAFRLPPCGSTTAADASSTENRLTLVVAEPNLQWLGLVTAGTQIALQINGIPVPLAGDGTVVSGLASPVNLPRANLDWIPLLGPNVYARGGNGTYRLELCDTTPHHHNNNHAGGHRPRHMWLHQLMGVMV